jgi:hypothetical protein
LNVLSIKFEFNDALDLKEDDELFLLRFLLIPLPDMLFFFLIAML